MTEQYELLEASILSGQVPDEDIQKIMVANPQFADWYAMRRSMRRSLNVSDLDETA